MDIIPIIGVVLAALLVGAAIPVLLQLRSTLRATQAFLEDTGRHLNRTLDEASKAAGRINRVAANVEEGSQGLQQFARAATDLAKSLRHVQRTVHTAGLVAGAIGPAIVAGARTLFSSADGRTKAHQTEARDPGASPRPEVVKPSTKEKNHE